MYILGVGDVIHDPSVCLMKNGQITTAIELERLTRVKHNFKRDSHFYSIEKEGQNFSELLLRWTPDYRQKQLSLGIEYCLRSENIRFDDIDTIVCSSLFSESVCQNEAVSIEHHLAHSASAFYPSPYDEAAVVAIDGYGLTKQDNTSTSVEFTYGKNNVLDIIDSIEGKHEFSETEKKLECKNTNIVFSNSLGVFYQNISMLLGMNYNGEGKTMGLAGYGKPNKMLSGIREFIRFFPNGKLEIDNRECFIFLESTLSKAQLTLSDDRFFQFKADLAYIHQSLLEEMLIHLCRYAYQLTRSKNLCLAGGVALNSVANSKIITQTPFENIFVQPAASDAGISLGCALYGAHYINKISRPSLRKKAMFTPFLGKTYHKDDISEESIKKIASYKQPIESDELNEMVAILLSQGKIVAWFKGASEIGPRALGARSILADPRNKGMKKILNEKVKFREFYRPFAPAILENKVSDYFSGDPSSPYMLSVAMAKKFAKERIPATIHIDNTARLQTVNKELTPIFYDLIEQFEKITNVPVILNTSFNRKDEPIVEKPEDAIDCFLDMSIDVLVLEDDLYIKT